MAIFGSDTIETSGGSPAVGTGAGAGTVSSDGLCVTPPNGHPSYNRVVLDTLHGEGKITASEYSRVKAGQMSIVDLSISNEELARLRCDSGESRSYDPHFDPDLNPTISSIPATVNASFASGTTPTDKAHRLTIETTTTGILTGNTACRVNFAREYEDDGGVVARVVQVICENQPTLDWTVANVTSQHYDLISRGGMGAAITATVGVTVTPVRKK